MTRPTKRKFEYEKIIQQNPSGAGWEDVSAYETNSSFRFPTKEARDLFRHDLREYQFSNTGAVRVIRRRTKIQ